MPPGTQLVEGEGWTCTPTIRTQVIQDSSLQKIEQNLSKKLLQLLQLCGYFRINNCCSQLTMVGLFYSKLNILYASKGIKKKRFGKR